MRLAIAVLALCAAPTVAHAQSVEIRDGELVLGATYPWRVDASYAFQLADVPVWLHAQITPQAEGAGLSIGLRPTLAVIDDYRLIWASRVGPIVYGRDGASGGAELVSELLNVFGAQEVRFALGPRIDFAAAGGDQSAWRLRTTLTLALGLVESIVSVWVAASSATRSVARARARSGSQARSCSACGQERSGSRRGRYRLGTRVACSLSTFPCQARAVLPFTLHHTDTASRARRGTMLTAHGPVETPTFMAVGTRATVTGLDPHDLRAMGASVVLGNTYHLLLRPGPELFRRVGGIHSFMKWNGPVLTDSGGYQIFSLASDRTIDENGARFRSYVDGRIEHLTPERSIEMQTAIGSDIMMVLDHCIDSRSDEAATRAAMERTHRWALRSLAARTNPNQALFAIVQGGVVPTLRTESASFLTQQPFDGFALGGLAVGDTRAQREDITHFAAELLPSDRPRYLMGVGTPPDLLYAMMAGIDMFDCVIPTHFAWQGTAFTSTGRVRVTRSSNATLDTPLDESCACSTCARFSRSYLHHLFHCKEPLGPRLLSIHNLSHYFALMADARAAIDRGEYASFARQKLDQIDRHEHSEKRLGARAEASA